MNETCTELTDSFTFLTPEGMVAIDKFVTRAGDYWAPEVQISDAWGYRVIETTIHDGSIAYRVIDNLFAVVTANIDHPEDTERHYVENMTMVTICLDATDPGGTEVDSEDIEYQTMEVTDLSSRGAFLMAQRALANELACYR